MKKIITFGQHSAELHADEHRAALYMDEKSLPVELADVLNEAGDIHVHNVQKTDDGFGVIGITHDLLASDLLAEVCDSITRVYDTDTTVSNARP
ncbi:hypothetical protein ED352_11220 [Muribaculaceae bacterium Isolate-002 (NCI)]|nr:hypothetical protein ED352_11220 [Muribaculaceae bacterium Isolate-002 (NCI)]